MHLPKGTKVPRQGERQIEVRDLLTHSAGLPPTPSRMKAKNPEDPWADLTEQEVLDSLGDLTLNSPIGSTTAYSNFGMAVVSLAVSRAYGTDFETAIRSAVF
jgi:CubicO group peptidase (beta-lactamase class C family)